MLEHRQYHRQGLKVIELSQTWVDYHSITKVGSRRTSYG
jgi:hypothetical protein